MGVCVLMLELVDISQVRGWFPFYFHHIGRAITFILYDLPFPILPFELNYFLMVSLVTICYTGSTYALALFIIGFIAAGIWIALPWLGVSHDMGPMSRGGASASGGNGSYAPVSSPPKGQYQDPPRQSEPQPARPSYSEPETQP
jgi:hypothetical protein